MSCNGCRVLRKGCSETCILRSCLQWIPTPQAQANATLFLAKFFGRSDLMSLISAVPVSQRPALFQSLLFEACGRTVNPVNGAVGLLWSGNWHMCQAAVETVLAGGILQPLPGPFAGLSPENYDETSSGFKVEGRRIRSTTWQQSRPLMLKGGNQVTDHMNRSLTQIFCSGGRETKSFYTGESESLSTVECDGDRKELLNLFV